jgi:dipeptidyl aminopeptidase/acylaminoacyl peptidase
MEIPLIPRKVLFDNPDRSLVRISPDGSQIAWLAPREGVLNVWVAPREELDAARPVTDDTGRGVRMYGWAFNNTHILYLQDQNGDENWRIFSVDLTTGSTSDLTPIDGVQVQPRGFSHKFPHEIVAGINDRDEQFHDLYRINILSGERTLLFKNERFMDLDVDDDYRVRTAFQMTPDGGADTFLIQEETLVPWQKIPPEDLLTVGTLGFDRTNRRIYLKSSIGRDTAALYEYDLNTHQAHLIAEDPRADAEAVLLHPTEKNLQAVSFVYDRKHWQVLDPSIQPDLDYLGSVSSGELEIVNRSLDDRYWIVVYLVDDGPTAYYLYDRPARNARFLFTNRKALEDLPLAKMHSTVIKSRDGLDMVVYYSLPFGSESQGEGVPDLPVPMVLTPHGGPWGRDYWGFNPWHQWLANRGYAVLAVNFRSSTGFGKSFTNAGDQEWGGKIMEDQIDAVQWAIDKGIADLEKVAVMGGSFGGYSTLAGLTFYPDTFACGVDIVGPSNLITLLESLPPYWKPMLELFTTRVGDHRTEEGRALLRKHSPLSYVDRIRTPLLIAQGANDPRVKQAESDQIVQSMQDKNIPVTYVLYPDEGHGFARPENNLSFSAIAEAFLSRCLGGRFEPITNDFNGSSLQVLVGAEHVPGLSDALG